MSDDKAKVIVKHTALGKGIAFAALVCVCGFLEVYDPVDGAGALWILVGFWVILGWL